MALRRVSYTPGDSTSITLLAVSKEDILILTQIFSTLYEYLNKHWGRARDKSCSLLGIRDVGP